MIALLIFVLVAQPSQPGEGTLVHLLLLALGGGVGAFGLSLYKQRFQGRNERDQLIADASAASVTAAKEMLEEYRFELNILRGQIGTVKEELARANERIAALEGALVAAGAERDRLQVQYNDAVERRAKAESELAQLQQRVTHLTDVIERREVARAPITRRSTDPADPSGSST